MFIDICLIYIEIMFTARYPDATCEKHDTNGNLRLNKPKNQTSTKQKTPNFTYIVCIIYICRYILDSYSIQIQMYKTIINNFAHTISTSYN